MIVAALLVIPLIVIEESGVGEPWMSVGVALNWGTWIAFVAEVAIMLAVVPERRRWLRDHPLDVAIVVLTPPFLTALAPIRLLRLLRPLRLLRLAPFARRLFSGQGLLYAALLAALTATVGGAVYAELEPGRSTADGLYWAITTMTTVGYGDLLPTTTAAKLLAVVVMLVGIGFVAILTGAVAERFLRPDVKAAERDVEAIEETILRELRDLSGRVRALEAQLRRDRA